MAVAGKVAITPKGLYVTGNTYDRLDMVSNNNKIYVARKSTNVEPTGTENTDDWMFIIESDQQNLKDLAQKIDDLQNEMENTYQKKTEVADRAIHDSEGNEFAKTYLKRNSIDNILSNKSTNPPQNKVVAEAIAGASIASTGGGQSTSVTLNPLYKYLLMSGTASSPVIYFVYYEGDKWYCGNGNATFGSFSGNTFTFGSDHSGGSRLYKI
ncbi:MAG: hypothetical protein U0J62_05215 [Lachnospiraceae bacterium]|nr:hypothetical protein [Lachnospiraceae bacterium]